MNTKIFYIQKELQRRNGSIEGKEGVTRESMAIKRLFEESTCIISL